MRKFLRSIPRLRKSAAKDMRRHFSMTFSSILSISIALLLCIVMAVLALTTDRIAQSVENQLQLQAALSPVLSEEQIVQAGEAIASTPGVARAEFSSREQELDKLIAENGQMFEQYREANPLYDVYIVEVASLDDLEDISQTLRQIPGVAQVSYGGEAVIRMISVFQTIRTGGWLLAAALLLLCIVLIRNTIRMTVMVRSDEIAIMRTVGAGSGYIATPFLLEGLTMGFWGALIASAVVALVYYGLYYVTDGALVSSLFSLYPPMPFLLYVCSGGFVLGLIIGLLGSLLGVNTTLRRVR